MEFAGVGAMRCGEHVTLRKVGDASQKVKELCSIIILYPEKLTLGKLLIMSPLHDFFCVGGWCYYSANCD